jgi:hypothetical protein
MCNCISPIWFGYDDFEEDLSTPGERRVMKNKIMKGFDLDVVYQGDYHLKEGDRFLNLDGGIELIGDSVMVPGLEILVIFYKK